MITTPPTIIGIGDLDSVDWSVVLRELIPVPKGATRDEVDERRVEVASPVAECAASMGKGEDVAVPKCAERAGTSVETKVLDDVGDCEDAKEIELEVELVANVVVVLSVVVATRVTGHDPPRGID
ncbi:hypothetical protein HDU93_007136 [Gonapodya sp. JEL0774]|nr:hypothetical protein HDU93_007136 [Gonapodya sp. JEL0774]